MKVIKISSNDTVQDMDIPSGLESLQGQVGGYIQFIDLRQGVSMVMNEEGKLMGLPANRIATEIFTEAFGPSDIIVGDVLLVGVDSEGETTDLPSTGDWIPVEKV